MLDTSNRGASGQLTERDGRAVDSSSSRDNRASIESRSVAGDEMSLVDLWLVLARRKWLVIGVFFATLIGAVVWSSLQTPIYESRAIVQIGKLTGVGLIEEPVVTLRRLREVHGLEGGMSSSFPRVSAVELQADSGYAVILLRGQSHTPEEAQTYLASVSAELVGRHESLYKEIHTSKQNQVQTLDAEIELLEGQLETLAELVAGVKDPSQAAIVAMERGVLVRILAEKREERDLLVLSLSPITAYPTRVVMEPTMPDYPVQPGPILHLSIGLALGLMLGVLAASLAEFIAIVRERSQERYS